MLQELFSDILSHYLTDTDIFNLAPRPRRLEDYTSFSILTNQLPLALREEANIDHNYKVKGSAGNGNIPAVPHICVFDRSITLSAEKGYYIVYLFAADMSTVYLSLNQGWTEYEKQYGVKEGRQKVRTNTLATRTYLRSATNFDLSPIDLKTKGSLGKGYELANICSKKYTLNALPNDAELINDLRNLMGVYRELKGLVGNSILNIVANLTESDYQNALQAQVEAEAVTTPVGKKELRDRSAYLAYPRDPVVAAEALRKADYHCENDPHHMTFTHAMGHQFMEAHHLIPLAFQDDFAYSLDVISNIICLCPNCHRAFHLAPAALKNTLMEKFLNQRAADLESQGIVITLIELKNYYHLDESLTIATAVL